MKELKIRVRNTEAGSEAIERYMKCNGYKKEIWKKAHAERIYYIKGEECLMVYGQRPEGKSVVFEIGNA